MTQKNVLILRGVLLAIVFVIAGGILIRNEASAALSATLNPRTYASKKTVDFEHDYSYDRAATIFSKLDEFLVKCDSSDVKIYVLGKDKAYRCGTDFRKFVKNNENKHTLTLTLQFENTGADAVKVEALESYYVCNLKPGDTASNCSGKKTLDAQSASFLVPPTNAAGSPTVRMNVNGGKETMVFGHLEAPYGYPVNNKDPKTLEWSVIGADQIKFENTYDGCAQDIASGLIFNNALRAFYWSTPASGKLTETTSNYDGCVATIKLTGSNSVSGLASSDEVKIYFGLGDKKDDTAPTTPLNLSATATSLKQIDLSWDFSRDNLGVLGYKIYRDGELIARVKPYNDIPGPANSEKAAYSDKTVKARVSYTYAVEAYDFAGNLSKRSAAVTAKTFMDDDVPPATPVISSSCFSCRAFNTLSFEARSAEPFDGNYRVYVDNQIYGENPEASNRVIVYRSLRGSSANDVYDLITLTYPFDGYHNYVVVAEDRAGNESSPSNRLSIYVPPYDFTKPPGDLITTPENPPSAPTNPNPGRDERDDLPAAPVNLEGKAVSSSRIDLSWSLPSDNRDKGVLGYRIYRNGTFLVQVPGRNYSDSSLYPESTYVYSVATIDNSENVSAQTSPISVRTLSAPAPSVAGTLKVDSAASVPEGTISAGTPGQVVGGFAVTATGEPVSVRDLVFVVVLSPTSESPVMAISLYDENGRLVAGPSNARTKSLSGGSLMAQPFTISGPIVFPVGTHAYILRATLPEGLPVGTTLFVTATPSLGWMSATGQVSGKKIDLSNEGRFVMSTMSVGRSAKKLVVPGAKTDGASDSSVAPGAGPGTQPQSSPTPSPRPSGTSQVSPSVSSTPRVTSSASPSPSRTPTATPSPSATRSPMPSPTPTATSQVSPSVTPAPSSSPANSPIPSHSPSPSAQPASSSSPTPAVSQTPTAALSLVTPNGGTYYSGDTVLIVWSASNLASNITIDLVDKYDALVMNIASNVPKTGSYYYWSMPRNLAPVVQAAFKVRISASGGSATLSDTSDTLMFVYPSPAPTPSASPTPTATSAAIPSPSASPSGSPVSYKTGQSSQASFTGSIWQAVKAFYSFVDR